MDKEAEYGEDLRHAVDIVKPRARSFMLWAPPVYHGDVTQIRIALLPVWHDSLEPGAEVWGYLHRAAGITKRTRRNSGGGVSWPALNLPVGIEAAPGSDSRTQPL